MRRIYLDANASAPLRPEARAACAAALDLDGNPSSLHAAGRRGRAVIEEAREAVAALVGADPDEVFFTSGGTEANAWALKGLGRDGRVAISAIEHASVMAAAPASRTVLLGVDAAGRLDPAGLERAFPLGPSLVSVQWANNEIGTIQSVADVVARCRARGVAVHTDAVQAVGRLGVDLHESGVDAASISAHKIGGPKGVGALYVRRAAQDRLRPLIGGEQEEGARGGTENVVGIAGMGAAATATAARWRDEAARERRLRDGLLDRLRDAIPDLVVHGETGDGGLPNTLNVAFPGIEGEAAVLLLDARGVACSTGSACHAAGSRPSHVLEAIGVPADEARATLRFSLSWATTEEEVDEAAEIVAEVVRHLRSAAPARFP